MESLVIHIRQMIILMEDILVDTMISRSSEKAKKNIVATKSISRHFTLILECLSPEIISILRINMLIWLMELSKNILRKGG